MKLTRRELATAGLALGAGCLSGGSNVRYPGDAAAEGAAADGEPLVDEGRETAAASEGTDRAPPNPAFARLTRGIYDEVRWFATGYEPAIGDYRDAVEATTATVQRIRERGDLNENTLSVVERSLNRLLSTIENRMEPHFNVTGYVESETTRHVAVARTFASRGDIDRAQEELGRLESFLENITRQTYVNRNMSRNPVRNRLLAFLRAGNEGEAEDSSGELFEVWDPETGFTTYAYGGPSRIRDGENGTDAYDEQARSRYGSRFAPALAGEREGAVHVLARRLPQRSNQPDSLVPDQYPVNAIAVQRFADVETATGARKSLVDDGPLSVEGTARLGGTVMDRIFYRAVGDVVYAFLFQTAEFLVVVAPSEVAWNERIDWSRGLQRTWLWSGGESG